MADAPESVDLNAEMGDAIAGVIQRGEDGLVLKWVTLIETISTDGSRGLWIPTSPSIKSYETSGLLTYGLQREQAKLVAERSDEL